MPETVKDFLDARGYVFRIRIINDDTPVLHRLNEKSEIQRVTQPGMFAFPLSLRLVLQRSLTCAQYLSYDSITIGYCML